MMPLHADTIPELLKLRADASPNREALRFEGRGLTWKALALQVHAVAQKLQAHGVKQGDRVALVLPNGLDFPVAWLAVPLVRAVAVPINVHYKHRDLAQLIKHSGAAVALAGKSQRLALEELRAECPTLTTVWTFEDGVFDPPVPSTPGSLDPLIESEPTDPVTIQYTSGTTGLPKGCVVDHGYWLRLARTVQQAADLGQDDVLLTAQPLSYMDPSWNLVIALMIGAPLVILPRFSASRFWTQVAENRATFFYCVGTMPLYLLKRPPDATVDRGHCVRLAYCSGIPAAVHQEMEDRWGCPWRETYGTTELGVVLLVPPEDQGSTSTANMGRPVEGRRVRVEDESGTEVQEGENGELLVAGPDLMQGYYDDLRATLQWNQDGWAHTGDIVRKLPGGGFVLVGRKKDMIRRGGENVSAAQVEAVLAEHPNVRAAACIPVPDDLRHEEVKAYVQLVDGGGGNAPDAAAIHAFVAERLASFKVPRYIEFVDTFPLTQSNKIAKAELIEAREDHRTGAWDAQAGPTGAE